MSDFFRYLPLSQRDTDDAPATTDRRDELAAVVATMLELHRRDPAFDLDRSLRRTRLEALWQQCDGDKQRLGERVLERKRSIRDLASVVAGAWREADRVGQSLAVDPMTAGAIALYASGTASFERRAVIAGHTVRASDAPWEFGNGPVLEGTAGQIAAFLLGVSEQPPRPPEPTPAPTAN